MVQHKGSLEDMAICPLSYTEKKLVVLNCGSGEREKGSVKNITPTPRPTIYTSPLTRLYYVLLCSEQWRFGFADSTGGEGEGAGSSWDRTATRAAIELIGGHTHNRRPPPQFRLQELVRPHYVGRSMDEHDSSSNPMERIIPDAMAMLAHYDEATYRPFEWNPEVLDLAGLYRGLAIVAAPGRESPPYDPVLVS